MDFGTLIGMTAEMMDDTRQTAQNTSNTVQEIESLRSDLERARNDLASYKAEQAEQREADCRQADLNAKKAFRHDYHVAAFSIVITLAIEHFAEIYDFLRLFVKSALSFLQ